MKTDQATIEKKYVTKKRPVHRPAFDYHLIRNLN